MKQHTSSRSHARANSSANASITSSTSSGASSVSSAVNSAAVKRGTFVRGLLSEDAFVLRPVNRDNQRELDLVIELLQRHQNSDALTRGISDFEFLSGQFSDLESDEQMVSMLLFHHAQPVAHVALRFDRDTRCPEIVLPAIDPEYQQYLMTFSELFWQKIQHLAERQNWELIYQLSPVTDAALQIVTAKQCDALEMAILPDPMHTAVGNHQKANQALVLLVHLFRRELDRPRYLYPPSDHAKKVSELYAPLDANRLVVHAERIEIDGSGTSEQGHSLRWRRLSGLEELSVIPTALGDVAGFLTLVKECAARAETQASGFWVRVAMDDPKCAALCALLEEQELRFCGVFPISEERDWILYSRVPVKALPADGLRTPRGRQLSQYLSRAARNPHLSAS